MIQKENLIREIESLSSVPISILPFFLFTVRNIEVWHLKHVCTAVAWHFKPLFLSSWIKAVLLYERVNALFPETQSLRLLPSTATEHQLWPPFHSVPKSGGSQGSFPSGLPPPTHHFIPASNTSRAGKKGNTQTSHSLKIQRRNRSQGSKHPPNKDKGRNRHLGL